LEGVTYATQWIIGNTSTNWTPSADLEPGSYTWQVQGWSPFGYGTLSSVRSFDTSGLIPNGTTGHSPTGLQATARPTFTWDAVADSTWYQLWFNRNGTKYLTIWVPGTSTTNWTSPTNMPMGSYVWWVQSWNKYGYGPWSASNTFTVPDFRPGASTPLSPTGNVVLNTFRPEFVWTQVATSGWYQVWLNRNGGKHIAFWQEGTASTNWTSPTNMPAGNWQWWVRTWNTFGYGPWSAPANCVIPGTAPAVSACLTPSGVVAVARPAFTWREVPRSTWYQVWINSGSVNYANFWLEGQGTTNWTPSADIPTGSYSWWIRTWNKYGYGPWSAKVNFNRP
jgi:hypothetical protein